MLNAAAVFAASLAVQMVPAFAAVVGGVVAWKKLVLYGSYVAVAVAFAFAFAFAAAVVAFVVIVALQVVYVLHVAVAITVVAAVVITVVAAVVATHNYWKCPETWSSYSAHCYLYYNNTGFVFVAVNMHYYTLLAASNYCFGSS